MKVAVLLTGLYRTFDQTSTEIKSKFDVLNPDYFINTYDKRYNYHPCVASSINCHIDEDISLDNFSSFEYKDILIDSLSESNTVLHERQIDFSDSMKNLGSDSYFLQIWKLLRGINLISDYENEHHVSYDFVIICRMDAVPRDVDSLDFSQYNDTVYLHINYDDTVNDHILISSKENLFNMLTFMYNEFYSFTYGNSNHQMPHRLFANSIDYCKLNKVTYLLSDYILRYGGTKSVEATYSDIK